eukprot:6024677-Prymnesium_polylepis.1
MHSCATGNVAVSNKLPLPWDVRAEHTTGAVEANGLNAPFSEKCHCVAAEPYSTFIRIACVDDGQEVAYETAGFDTGFTCSECAAYLELELSFAIFLFGSATVRNTIFGLQVDRSGDILECCLECY